jgi:GTP cyclohydrolase IB
MNENECLPDIQCEPPNIKRPIQQVGVENVEVPFRLESKYGGFHQLNANVSMRTFLDENTKGISMSRLLLTLKPYLDLPLKHKLIKQILDDINVNLGSIASYMKFEFRMPINKKSIISENSFPIYYKCRFEGQRIHADILGAKTNIFKFFQGVIIQYASYCPCSAELCNHLTQNGSFGFPHNQRSFADILIEVEEPNYIWLEDIVESVEMQIKTLPYPVIKREDEQEIAKVAAKNPLFVEDAIRVISQTLDNNSSIKDFIVKCKHEESIHTSEAIAINWKGINGGFDDRRFI